VKACVALNALPTRAMIHPAREMEIVMSQKGWERMLESSKLVIFGVYTRTKEDEKRDKEMRECKGREREREREKTQEQGRINQVEGVKRKEKKGREDYSTTREGAGKEQVRG